MANGSEPTYSGKTREKQKNFSAIITPLVTGAISVIATVITLQATVLDTAFTRISTLEDALDRTQEQLRRVERELADRKTSNEILRMRLNSDFFETPMDSIGQFIDAIPGPAWCKRAITTGSQVSFVMREINPTYTAVYGVTEARYLNETDIIVHEYDETREYYEADLNVYNNKNSQVFEENVVIQGQSATATVWKSYLRTSDNNEYICGIQIRTVYNGDDYEPN